MNTSEALMLSGIAAACPDCAEERVLVEVTPDEFCCVTCDAAILLVEMARGAP